MSDALILAVVGMVCVTIGVLGVLALVFGRKFYGRASTDSIELSTGPDERQQTANGSRHR